MTKDERGGRAERVCAWLAAGAVAALFLAASIQKIWGVDTWWQMAAGRYFVEQRTFPLNDVLSYSAAGNEWIEVRWVFCVLMHVLWSVGGAGALIGMQVVLMGVAWGVMVWGVRRAALSPMVLLALGVGIAAGLSRWVVRPELFTYALSAVFVVCLDREQRKTGALAALVVLQVLWSNAHTLFVMGPVLAWIFAVGENAERVLLKRRGGGVDWRIVGFAAAVTLACLANPYLLRGAMFPILLFTQIQEGHVVSRSIGEMASPLSMPLSRWTPDLYAAVGVLVLAALSFVARGKRLSVGRLLVLVAMAYLAAKAQRNAALVAVLGTWTAMKNFEEAWVEGGGWAEWMRRMTVPVYAAAGIGSVGLAWYVATDRMSVSIGAPRETGVGVVWWNTAAEAVEFMNTAKPKGPVFNTIRDGGYIAWASRGEDGKPYKVFADGRLEVYGPDHIGMMAELGPQTWPEVEKKWGFNTAVVPVHDNEALAAYLLARPDWALVHVDARTVVFVREIPEHAELIRWRRPDLTKVWLDGMEEEAEDAPPKGMWRALGAVGRPFKCEGMAEVFLALGAPQRAVPWLERAHQNYPDRERTRAVLGQLYWAAGRDADADRMLTGLDEQTRLIAAREAARMMMAGGNYAGAIAPLRLAVVLAPEASELRLALADAAFQAGEFKTARENYATLLRANPTVNEINKYAFACEQLGDLAASARAYGDSVRVQPNQPAVWNMLGGVLAKAGDLAKARECFMEALRQKPDFEAARKNLEALGARQR
jgi:Flp pilus assembly protein TadD